MMAGDTFERTNATDNAALKTIMDMEGKAFKKKPVQIRAFLNDVRPIHIKTLEGVMTANVGDWVIEGVNGEFYPCKPDVFHKTYEEVSKQ